MPITTPCIKVCARDAASGVCFGCGRIGPEIAHWFRLTDAERDAILAALPARLAAFGLPPGGDREQGLRVAREQRLRDADVPP